MQDAWTNTFPVLGQIEPGLKESLIESATEISLPVGHKLFQSGEGCDDYLMVLSGAMRVCLLSESGREIVLYRVRSGQTCFLTTSCLLTNEVYPAEGNVEETITAVLIPAHLFTHLMSNSVVFRNFVFTACGSRISRLMKLVETIAFERIDLRIARFLITSRQCPGTLKITHQQIASELGTAREVVSRQLKLFEKNGWVELKRNAVVVTDHQALISLEQSGELM